MKTLCILSIRNSSHSTYHSIFSDKNYSDLYYAAPQNTHDTSAIYLYNNEETIGHIRNQLIKKVPRNYKYYGFIDEKDILKSKTSRSLYEQILFDLNRFNPAVYTPSVDNSNNDEYYIKTFCPFGVKFIHHSLLDWFFPLDEKTPSFFFGLLELPYYHHIVVSNSIHHENPTVEENSLDITKCWFLTRIFFKNRCVLDEIQSATDYYRIIKYYDQIISKKHLQPIQHDEEYDFSRIKTEELFDYDHPYFLKKYQNRDYPKEIVVVGNGPSLKREYFDIIKSKGLHSISMNAAYRYYKEMDWYPTYFSCYDYVLLGSHLKNIGELILDPSVPIKKFFLIDVLLKNRNDQTFDIHFPDEIRTHNKFVGYPSNQDGRGWPEYGTNKNYISSTGANSVRFAAALGYKKIYLLGMDCNYVQTEKFKDAVKITEWKYRLDKTPKDNPNYFWKDYQRQGDAFNRPGDQLPSWRRLTSLMSKYFSDVSIINCSINSRIDCFPKKLFEEIF